MAHGIFLEECFRKILEANLNKDGYIEDDEKINKLLCENIYGVDINEEAIDVTIFSLYLTIMDYKNPKSLQNYHFPNLKNLNLFVSDFFDENLNNILKTKKFDLIIGNPPWGSVKGNHIEYCNKNNLPHQRAEISRSFVFKAKELCNENTKCCLVLPAKLLYNKEQPAIKTRNILLENTKIEKIVEMSAVRKLIFKNAVAPSFIIIFKKNNEDYLKNNIEYVSFKPNIFFELFNIILIERDDIKNVSQAFLNENDWAWKTILYGTNYDIDIIKKLKSNYSNINEIIEENNFISKTGISANDGEKDSTKYIGKKLINSDNGIDHFMINTNNLTIFEKEKIYRVGNEEQFKPPYCLFKKGVNIKNYKNRSVYTEEEIIYLNGITCIKGKEEDKEVLKNITGLLNSSLYAYLNLMLSASIGVEREQIFIEEIKKYPYIYDSNISNMVDKIQKEKQNFNMKTTRNDDELIEQLDNTILEKFNLLDNEFIDYALNVQIPIINCKKNYIMKMVNENELKIYARYFQEYFTRIFKGSNKNIKIVLYPKVKSIYSIFELIISETETEEQIEIMKNIDNNKELLSRFMINKTTDNFYQIKDVINFEENSFFIIKTREFKNWHPAMAKLDLEEVIDEMLSGNGGEE